jgi:hypothetical protein
MLAWENAVAVNTGASFEAFLASHANSDLAATAVWVDAECRKVVIRDSHVPAGDCNSPAQASSCSGHAKTPQRPEFRLGRVQAFGRVRIMKVS